MKNFAKTIGILIVVLLSLNTFVAAQASDAPKSTAAMVNLNTAGQAELEALPGIGPSLAKKILEFRQKNGNFKTTADLIAVQGIGEKKYEAIKHLVTVK